MGAILPVLEICGPDGDRCAAVLNDAAVPATPLSVVALYSLCFQSDPATRRLVTPYVTFSHSLALLQARSVLFGTTRAA